MHGACSALVTGRYLGMWGECLGMWGECLGMWGECLLAIARSGHICQILPLKDNHRPRPTICLHSPRLKQRHSSTDSGFQEDSDFFSGSDATATPSPDIIRPSTVPRKASTSGGSGRDEWSPNLTTKATGTQHASLQRRRRQEKNGEGEEDKDESFDLFQLTSGKSNSTNRHSPRRQSSSMSSSESYDYNNNRLNLRRQSSSMSSSVSDHNTNTNKTPSPNQHRRRSSLWSRCLSEDPHNFGVDAGSRQFFSDYENAEAENNNSGNSSSSRQGTKADLLRRISNASKYGGGGKKTMSMGDVVLKAMVSSARKLCIVLD